MSVVRALSSAAVARRERTDDEAWEAALDFELPPELIAQTPCPARDASRLLVVDRERAAIRHAHFTDLEAFLDPGDLLVANDSRVLPARLLATKPSGGRLELLIVDGFDALSAQALARGLKGTPPGTLLTLEDGSTIKLVAGHRKGRCRLDFAPRTVAEVLAAVGRVPIPPYIRGGREEPLDRVRYQTVYARSPGSIAAPTAGLHFTPQTLRRLSRRGVCFRTLTLHVGPATFAPLRGRAADHTLEAEHAIVPPAVVSAIAAARRARRRVVSVGTTSVRALESAADPNELGLVRPHNGPTDLFIRPGHTFRVVDAVLTNFHLPRSSLLCLVFAFGGVDLVRAAYAEAIRRRYRFYSYGDAMLIL